MARYRIIGYTYAATGENSSSFVKSTHDDKDEAIHERDELNHKKNRPTGWEPTYEVVEVID